MQSSDARRAVPQLLPHPVNYRQVWACMKGKTPLVVWRPLPPEGFVALGMLVTADETPPPVESIHVPAGWTAPVRGVPAATLATPAWAASPARSVGRRWWVGAAGVRGATGARRAARWRWRPFAELEAGRRRRRPRWRRRTTTTARTARRSEESRGAVEEDDGGIRQSKSKTPAAPALKDIDADHKISFTKRASSTQI